MSEATGPVYKVAFRRRRQNITNYAKRLALVKGMLPRMVVRKSSTGVTVQFLEFNAAGDKVISSVRSAALRKFGWSPRCNTPTAYLCALLAAKTAHKKGVKEFILDIGMHTPSKGAIVFSAVHGAIDAGLSTNYTEEMIAKDRLDGSKIAAYAKQLKEKDEGAYKRIFSSYIKENFQPEKMAEAFATAKGKIASA